VSYILSFSHAVGTVLGDGTPTIPVAQAIPANKRHGSPDGLILLRLARATLGIEPHLAAPRLDELFSSMYEYINALENVETAKGIEALPGVMDHLTTLAARKHEVTCGLVTGNIEGIARRKMQAVGILDTRALAPPSEEQCSKVWPGSEHISFLGGFGSDYCSGNIDDDDYNYLDRAEQIAIATRRVTSSLEATTTTTSTEKKQLRRVVHVGDAPADVLAAKAFSETNQDLDLCIGMVAVATGSYSADELRILAGEARPGRWEPIILEKGMADPDFLKACGL
jgi:phosphoglycolate phosphatase-like HAD superfamily hydrolase